jgi:DNA anti-recombination protein RmuC
MTRTIKNASILAGAALATFAVAIVGAYFALPMVAPDMVAQHTADSTAASAADTTVAAAPAEAAQADSLLARSDSSQAAPSASAVARALRDSLQTLKEQLRTTQENADALQKETETLRQQLATAKNERVKAEELSSALLKMERRELTALLEEVEMSVLRQLYREASGRSRTRLLQSMSPNRAAQFVNQLVQGPSSQPQSPPDAPSSTPPSE